MLQIYAHMIEIVMTVMIAMFSSSEIKYLK